MHVVEETPEKLVLRHRPLWLALGIAAAFFGTAYVSATLFLDGDIGGGVMIGLGALLCLGAAEFLARPAWLTLDRAHDLVTFTERGLVTRVARSRPLSGIASAEIVRGRWTAEVGDQRGARTVLRDDAGAVFTLATAHASRRDAARAAAAVNRWLGAR